MPSNLSFADVYSNYLHHKLIYEWDKLGIRRQALLACKTQDEMDRLLDRWNIADAADKIADAVRSIPRERPRLFGIF